MAKILEYISLNYIWIIIGAIVIVLAIIGYYAEKSNFGQGKIDEEKSLEDDEEKLDLEKVSLSDLINKDKKNDQLENIDAKEIFNENSLEDIPSNDELDATIQFQPINPSNEYKNVNENLNEMTSNNINVNNDKPISNNVYTNDNNQISNTGITIDEISEDLFAPIEEVKPINADRKIENTSNAKINADKFDEHFKKFDEEFDSIVPEKDIFDIDILDDIENLSLDQNQVFDTNDIPDLDDVDLPEIRDTNITENDIWKF